jgi:2-oxoglutarate dehydrogenase E2 component (dihydrolipoamide succinyltransferase)
MGESITEGTVAAVLKHEGDPVDTDEALIQIETDKVTIDVRYTEGKAGVVKKMLVKEEDAVTVGQEVAVVEEGGAPSGGGGGKQESAKEEKAAPEPEAKPEQAPKEDKTVTKREPPAESPKQQPPQQQQQTQPKPKPAPQKEQAAPAPQSGAGGKQQRPERRVKMTRLRARVAERLKGAQNTYAMLTTFNEVDMTGIMQLRQAYKDAFLEKHGMKLGFMSAFVKASADALHLVPAVNAVIDGDEIVYRDYIDISIAVATPKGLVVPVLRDVDSMDFAGVEKAINNLGKKARDGTISIDDMAGGTFTISNGGVYGSMLSTPIINPPQSAILGMHSINQRATVINGQVMPRPIMNVALTYDHRLIDGREAVTFLKRVKEVVEDPRRLLLDC